MTKQLTRKTDDAEAGAFIGFDSSNESDVSEEEVWFLYDYWNNNFLMIVIWFIIQLYKKYFKLKWLFELFLLQNGNNILCQDNLLDGLPMWLDRLFEGLTHRYYINYWPEFTAK